MTKVQGPSAIIHDFNAEVQYIISRQFVGQCFATKLNQSTAFFDGILDEAGMVHLSDVRNLIFAGEQFNYSYEGVTMIRGVPVEGWSSIREFESLRTRSNLTNGLYEIFFTRPGLQLNTVVSSSTDRALWRLKLSGSVNFNFNGKSRTRNISVLNDFIGFSST